MKRKLMTLAGFSAAALGAGLLFGAPAGGPLPAAPVRARLARTKPPPPPGPDDPKPKPKHAVPRAEARLALR
jgi:hypothetical protein